MAKTDFRYQSMQPCHVPQLAAGLPAVLSGNWSTDSLRAMQEANHQLRVLDSAGTAIGFAEFLQVVDECQLFNIAILSQWQNQGWGLVLLNAVLAEARQEGLQVCLLEVRQSNLAACKLYQKAGFNQTGIRPGYYPALSANGSREAAILYSCSL